VHQETAEEAVQKSEKGFEEKSEESTKERVSSKAIEHIEEKQEAKKKTS
jgi:hypothetical protein